jgi:hypothetical protein
MNKWGWLFGWVGLGAFVLAIPMAIAANLLTPKVRDWWASTSRSRALKRYEMLRREIWRLKTRSDFDYLGRCLIGILGTLTAGFGLLQLHVYFVSLNQIYIAAINNMHLDAPIDTAFVHLEGTVDQYLMIVLLAFFFLFQYRTARLGQLVSTRMRKRQIARLRMRRFTLKKKFNLVGV